MARLLLGEKDETKYKHMLRASPTPLTFLTLLII